MPRRPGPPSPAQLDPTPVPPVVLARDVPRALRRSLINDGRLVAVRRGAYVSSELLAGLDEYQTLRTLALARVSAVNQLLETGAAMSHTSAAALWGLPLVTKVPQLHVMHPSNPSARNAHDISRHAHEVRKDHVTVHRGIPTTTLERTVVDCAMSLPLGEGLIVADAALHVGADLAECWRILEPMAGFRGVRTARAVLNYADGGAESSGETLLRLAMLRAGLPRPSTQVRVVTPRGTYWADVGWRELRVLGEYDGVAKYGANGTATEIVLAEKRRQEAIEDEGFRMFRAVNEDLDRVEQLDARVRRLARFGPVIDRPELFPTPPRTHPTRRRGRHSGPR